MLAAAFCNKRMPAVLILATVVLWPSCALTAEYIAGEKLRRLVSGNTIKAQTAKDRERWQVTMEANGRAHFTLTDGSQRSARWRIADTRIDFKFDETAEHTCRMVFIDDDRQQHWRDCNTGHTSSYILEPLFSDDAAATIASTNVADVNRKLSQEQVGLEQRGYEPWLRVRTDVVAQGSSLRHEVRFQAGSTYAVVAACDQSCSHVALALRDPTGAILAESPEQHHTVIVAGPVDQTGKFQVLLAVPGCRERQCLVGLQVLRLKKKN